MGVNRKTSKSKKVNRQHRKAKPSLSKKAAKQMQGAAKCASWPTAVSLLLQLLPIAVMGMLLVVSFHSLPVSTAATAFKNDVWAALPGVTTTQTLSLALVITAVSAAVAESSRGSRKAATSTNRHVGPLWQALDTLLKMVLYCGSAFFLAFVILVVAKSHCVWQLQAVIHDQVPSLLLDVVLSQGFRLPVTVIGSSALVLECFLETNYPRGDDKQHTDGLWKACMYLVKSVLYGCAAYGFFNMVFAVGDAASRWASQGGLGDYLASLGFNISMGPLLAVTITLAAVSALMIEGYFIVQSKRKLINVSAGEDMTANAPVSTPMSTPVSTPSEPLHAKVPHAATMGQKHSAKLLALDHKTAKDAKPVKSVIDSNPDPDTIKAGHITTTERQIAAGNGQADVNKGQQVGVDGQSAGVIPDAFSKTTSPSTGAQTAVKKKTRRGGRRQRASTQTLTGETASAAATVNKASSTDQQEVAPATNTGSSTKKSQKKTKAVQDNPPAAESAVDWSDAYCAMVRAILKGAVGGPSSAQLDIAVCLAGLFQAVPTWMLTFGATHNKGCTALSGLQTFQSLLTGKQTAKDLLATLDEVTRTKSMALLLRSFVAAYIQKELHDSGCKDEGDGRLMAQDIMRMSPDADTPQCLQAVPQWQLTALRQVMSSALDAV